MSNEHYTNAYTALSKVAVESLSHDERERVWRFVADAHAQMPVESPYVSWSWFFHARVLVPALAVVLLVVGGGTTALADSARPGDVLFGVKRATETVRLALTPEPKKDAVRVAIAQERVEEIESLIAEETQRRSTRVSARTKQEPTPPQETDAVDATLSVARSQETSNEEKQEDASEQSEHEQPEATAMSLSVASDVVVHEEEVDTVAEEGEDTEDRTARWSKRDRDIRESLKMLGTVSTGLQERGNREGHEQVRKAIAHLSEKLNELPFEEEDTFKSLIADELPHVEVSDVQNDTAQEEKNDEDGTDTVGDTATTTPVEVETATDTATTTDQATTSVDILQSSGEVRIQQTVDAVGSVERFLGNRQGR